jgi:hypothetical protein
MGLDIRTQSSIGHPLYAVNDGYIYRIATNFSGYGNALYLKTDDENIVLYGHLNRFAKRLGDRLFELQIENQSYYVNKYFKQDEFPVRRGDIIGYSGNSGSSMGPHLHFEFRNEYDQALNPMTHGFPLMDNLPPKILIFSIIPLATGTHIDNSPLPQNYIPTQLTSNVYTLKDTILVTGEFGIATRIIDKIQNASNSYQIEKLELLVDSISVFSVQYDLLDFSEGENIPTVYGQPVSHPRHDDFQKLYRLGSYPKLTLHQNEKTGIINLIDGIHKLEIHTWDAAKNRSTLTFYVKSQNSPKNIKYKTLLKLNEYVPFENNSNIFDPKLLQLEKGTIFKLNSDIRTSDRIVAFIEKPDAILTFPLIKIGIDKYASEMIDPYFFQDNNSCGFLIYSDTIQKYEYDFKPELILPNSNNTVFSKDSFCSVIIENVYYDTILTWLTKVTTPVKINSINRKSNIYQLNPYGIPFKNDATVSLAISKKTDLKHCAVYTFNKKKSKWDFENSRTDTINNIISTKLSEPNIFTVLEDTKPPWFIFTYPKHRQVYQKNTLKKFTFALGDNWSGIDRSEETLKVFLDGKRIWVAFQPIEKEISYSLRDSLSIGEHNILINIQDRSGNSASKSIKFFIE